MADAPSALDAVTLDHADVSLVGELTDELARNFLEDLAEAPKDRPVTIVEVTTVGGDAELARRLVLEIGVARRRLGHRLVFVGKTQVYSAGVTLMSAFPKADRYLSRDCVLLIHCRQLEKTIEIAGPMRSSLPQVEALAAEIRNGTRLEEENFRRLIEGSDISFEDLVDQAVCNWYLTAEEAHRRGLVAAVL